MHLLRSLDFDQIDGLAQAGLGSELAGVQHTAAGGDNLATATMDGVSVHHHIAHLRSHHNNDVITLPCIRFNSAAL